MRKCRDKINWLQKLFGYDVHRFCELERKFASEIWSQVVEDWRRDNKDLKYVIEFINSNTFTLAHSFYKSDTHRFSVYFCVKCNTVVNEISTKYDELRAGLNDLYLGYQEYKKGNKSNIEFRYLKR